MNNKEKLSLHLAQLENLQRPEYKIESVRNAIIAITSYEQLASEYPTQKIIYEKKIQEIMDYINLK